MKGIRQLQPRYRSRMRSTSTDWSVRMDSSIRPFQSRSHALARKPPLIAQKSNDSVEIRRREFNGIVNSHLGPQKYLSNLSHLRAQRFSNFWLHVLNRSEVMDQFQRLFRTDSFDTVVEVGTDQDRKVDQLLARNPVVTKHRAGIDQLWRDSSKNTFARKKFFTEYREKAKKTLRPERQAIVIFARRGP